VSSGPGDFRGDFTTAVEPRERVGRASGPIALLPDAVAAPLDGADLAPLLDWAADRGYSVVPRGAGTGMPGGNVGEGISLDLPAHFTALDPVDPGTRSVRVEAGVVATRVDTAARKQKLRFPPLPSSADRCTVGGMLANNAAGARSFGHGAVRDWVESLEVVWADGSFSVLEAGRRWPSRFRPGVDELTRRARKTLPSWPRVRKNSSGYAWDTYLASEDPVQLLAGSEGTLGIITAARLRLQPLPAAITLAVVGLASEALLPELLQLAGLQRAATCEFLDRHYMELSGLVERAPSELALQRAEMLLLLEFDREPEEGLTAVRSFARAHGCGILTARDPARRRELWNLRHAASPLIKRQAEGRGRVSTQFIEDCVVPPDRLTDYLTGLRRILARVGIEAVIFGHAGDANVHVNPLLEVDRGDWKRQLRGVLEEVVTLVADLGGTLAGEHGDGRLRAPFLERIWGDEWAEIFRRTKRTFDPTGLLNPGVVIPLAGQDPLRGLTAERVS